MYTQTVLLYCYVIELFLCRPVHEENPVKLFKVSLNCDISEGWVLSVIHSQTNSWLYCTL